MSKETEVPSRDWDSNPGILDPQSSTPPPSRGFRELFQSHFRGLERPTHGKASAQIHRNLFFSFINLFLLKTKLSFFFKAERFFVSDNHGRVILSKHAQLEDMVRDVSVMLM